MEKFGDVAVGVLDRLLEGCQVIGFDWTYLYLNDVAVRQSHRSRETLLGRSMMSCFPGIELQPFFPVLARCMHERSYERVCHEFAFPDGSRGWFELRMLPVPQGVCVLSLDVTEERRSAEQLRRTEEQLRHAQKMEALGRLAGGVAHDFNNFLSIILACTNLVLGALRPDDPVREDVDEVRRASERAAALTRRLLAFSRAKAVEPRRIDLNEVVGAMQDLLVRLLGGGIELVFRADPQIGRVCADVAQLEQVIMNLVVNARDAMPRGGTLTIETRNVDCQPGTSDGEHITAPGPYVSLSVSDTGVGMSAETLAQIFEPFYTTKADGTGLGLSIITGIVKESGGYLSVRSEPERGASFEVFLPRVDCDSRLDAPGPPR